MTVRRRKAKADQVLGRAQEILGQSEADPAAGVRTNIREAFVRGSKLAADRLTALAPEGTVTLSGATPGL